VDPHLAQNPRHLPGHTVEMDWMLPGIAPTGKRVEVALVVIVHFRDRKLAKEPLHKPAAIIVI
jgi:carboxymethylenebutenolidase